MSQKNIFGDKKFTNLFKKFIFCHQKLEKQLLDGFFGKMSWSALDRALSDLSALNNQLVNTRIDFYNKIVDRDNSQMVFLLGWINRANKFKGQ